MFEQITNAKVRDCYTDEDNIYFLVEPGNAGLAIGKKGKIIKKIQRQTKKRIKIIEYSKDEEQFIKNMIPYAENIEINKQEAKISINLKYRGKVIGKGGSNIKKIRTLLKRNSKITNLKV